MQGKGKVILIGAGPGDPDLITVKGVKALGMADVVLYDALISEELLEYCPAHVEKIFVGKRLGSCVIRQEQINDLIVQRALEGKCVVRLKGGDPFVFGRGHEEMEYAQGYGLDVSIVPGISSSISVPASAGIPVTRRGMSESFWVITGTTKSHKLSEDLTMAAKSSATVIVLMGTKKLSEIVKIYQKLGRGSLPVAVIQDGTREESKAAVGIIDSILAEVEKTKVGNPAVIIIGEVAASYQPESLLTIAKQQLA